MQSDSSERDIWRELRNVWLFLCMSSFFILFPLTVETSAARIVMNLFMTSAILLALYAQSNVWKSVRQVFLILGILAAIAGWVPLPTQIREIVVPIIYAAFFFVSFSIYCYKLFVETEVDMDTLFAAGCAYLLLGFLFATIYMAMIGVDPDAIKLASGSQEPLFDMTYFSFVTLTTLGYGDIVPVSDSAQMLAAYEAVFGQIFVTVVVAELVGIHVAKKANL